MRNAGGAAALVLVLAGCRGGEEPAAEPAPGPAAKTAAETPGIPAVSGFKKAQVYPVPGLPPWRTRAFPPDPPGLAARREAMVEEQLRAIGVTDPRVLEAMAEVPRHLFVPPHLAARAYDDTPLPIGHGQTISAPDVVGYMSQALRAAKGDRVLDIGTGSGYQAAVLAEMGCRVFSIEILEPLAAEAKSRLERLSYSSITVRAGDGWAGWPEEAPFDGILCAAAPEQVPEPLLAQLKPGARLVIPVGPEGRIQRLLVLQKRADGGVDREETLAVRFVPMTRK